MSDMQESVGVYVSYAVESTLGTQSAGTGQKIRRVTTSLAVSKDSFQSAEVRPDQQISDMRHGVRRAAGSIEGELSTVTWDDWFEAAMRGTWAAGTSKSQADFTSIDADETASTLTLGSGDPIAEGFRVGDVIRLGGSLDGNQGKNFRITGFSGTGNRVIGVSPAPADIGSAVTTFTIAVAGKKLTNGVVKRSFTVEQVFPTLDASELFLGMRVGGFSLRVPPNGMTTISWDLQGVSGLVLESGNSPAYGSAADAPNTGVMAGPNGALRVNGADRAIVTSIDMALSVSLTSQPVVGSQYVPDIFYGRTQVTGNISAYFDSADLVNAFLAESEMDVVVYLESGSTDPKDFLCFNMQRVKLSGVSKSIGADDGVIVSFPFSALLASAGSGKDGTTLTIQRSNA